MRHPSWTLLTILAVLFAAVASGADEEVLGPFTEGKPQVAVRLELRVFEMPLRDARALVAPPQKGKGLRVAPASRDTAHGLEEMAFARPDVFVREFVRTTTLMDQTIILDDVQRESFVQDFDIEIVGSGRHIADPIIGTIAEGVSLEAHTQLRKEDMLLRLKGAWGAVIRPIPLFKTKLNEKSVEIQLPELRVAPVDEELAFRGEGWWLLRSVVDHTDARTLRKRARVVLVHAKRATYARPQLSGGDGTAPIPEESK